MTAIVPFLLVVYGGAFLVALFSHRLVTIVYSFVLRETSTY